MSHRKEAPFVENVLKDEYKLSRRKIKKLIALRLTYGKSVLFDTHRHQPRYPVDIICNVLIGCVLHAKQCGEQFELSVDEYRLWRQMFPDTLPNRSKPDRKVA